MLDQSISDVYTEDGTTTVVIEDIGNIPMPVLLKLTLDDGSILNTRLDVKDWLDGRRTIDFTVDTESPVTEVEIDPDVFFPDADRKNNLWKLSGSESD